MSARYFYSLLCDQPECFTPMFSSNQGTAWETRRDAAAQGWRHVRVRRPAGGPALSVDLCPDHRHFDDDDLLNIVERVTITSARFK